MESGLPRYEVRADQKCSQGRPKWSQVALFPPHVSPHFFSFLLILSSVRGESCTILTSIKSYFRQDRHAELVNYLFKRLPLCRRPWRTSLLSRRIHISPVDDISPCASIVNYLLFVSPSRCSVWRLYRQREVTFSPWSPTISPQETHLPSYTMSPVVDRWHDFHLVVPDLDVMQSSFPQKTSSPDKNHEWCRNILSNLYHIKWMNPNVV